MDEILIEMRRDTVTRAPHFIEAWADFWKRQRRRVAILDPEFDGPIITLERSDYAAH